MKIKFSENDLILLKKVSSIQNSVKIKKLISAANVNKSTFVFAKLQDFPENLKISIYKLDEFLKLIEIYSKNNEYYFEYNEENDIIIFNNGSIKTDYLTCLDEFLPDQPKEQELDFSFSAEISKDEMLELSKLEKILGLDSFFLFSDKEGLKINAVNSTTRSKSSILIDEEIKENFNEEISEFHKIPADDYQIDYCKRGILKFSSLNEDIIFYSTTIENEEDEYEDI